jgi:hypothetical protein
MTEEEHETFQEAIDQMHEDTREYLEAHGIGPDEYEYDPDLADSED